MRVFSVASVDAPVGRADPDTTTAPVLHAVTLPSSDVVSPAIVARGEFDVVCPHDVDAPDGSADESTM